MHRSHGLPSLASILLAPLLSCGSDSSTGATANGDAGASDATTEAGAPLDAGVQPDAATCSGDSSACLSGTAQADGFILTPTRLRAKLYRVFPFGAAMEQAVQIVAKDNTWAFSGLSPWAHYYVQFEPAFPRGDAVVTGALTRVGPLAVPVSPGASVAATVRPVELDVFEQSSPGAAMQMLAASAHLVETAIGSASVSILIGTTPTAMPYDTNRSAYYLPFATPTPAQSAYAITTSLTSVAVQRTWNLVADPGQLSGAITSPSSGATVPPNKDLTVTWSSQPAADYQRVELFLQTQSVYTSPQLDSPDIASETIPASSLGQPGTYVIAVAFTKANCPVTGGCVHASTLATEQIAVQ